MYDKAVCSNVGIVSVRIVRCALVFACRVCSVNIMIKNYACFILKSNMYLLLLRCCVQGYVLVCMRGTVLCLYICYLYL